MAVAVCVGELGSASSMSELLDGLFEFYKMNVKILNYLFK